MPTIEGENLTYRKELCPRSAMPARSRSILSISRWTSTVRPHAKAAFRKSADLVGLIADQFTHLAVFLIRESRWTETDRRLCALLMGIGMRLDRLAIKLLLRSR